MIYQYPHQTLRSIRQPRQAGQQKTQQTRTKTDYRYDEHGRTASKQTIIATQHYLYDALGRRIEKHQLSRDGNPYNRTRFLWDGLRMIQKAGPSHPISLYIYTD